MNLDYIFDLGKQLDNTFNNCCKGLNFEYGYNKNYLDFNCSKVNCHTHLYPQRISRLISVSIVKSLNINFKNYKLKYNMIKSINKFVNKCKIKIENVWYWEIELVWINNIIEQFCYNNDIEME